MPAVFATGADRTDGDCFVVITVQRGDPPAVAVDGKGVDTKFAVGRRVIRIDGRNLVLERWYAMRWYSAKL